MLPAIIGLTGRPVAGAGKDMLADYLAERYGYVKYAFAAPIKQLLNARFGWSMEQWKDRAWKETPSLMHGSAGSNRRFSPRSWAQWLGTEVGRFISPMVWVDLMEREFRAHDRRMVITDVRFDNEAERVRLLGGRVWCIVRPSARAIAPHISEQGVQSKLLDALLANTRTPDYLYSQAEELLHG
jgi:hypothetical protein